EIGTDLMAEAPRAGVDEHRHLHLSEPECARRLVVEKRVDALHFDEVVAGAHGPDLPAASFLGPLGDCIGIGAREAALRLGALDVLIGAEGTRALAKKSVELGP